MFETAQDIDDARRSLKRWRKDPVAFVREVFGAEPDPWQADFLMAFADVKNQRIAAKACKGPGKTCVLAWIIWNFLATRPHPKIACTSITGDNLADGLWTELALWRSKSPLLKHLFEWTKTRIFLKESPETWWAAARKWSMGADTQQQANALAGLHADYLLFVLDESGGIPDGVMAAAEAGLSTGKEVRLLQCGNPTHLEGPLYRACTSEAHLWHVIEITGDPDDPKRSPRISKQWAEEQIEKYGRDNPWVLVNVFGRFPPSSLNALLGPDDVTKAMARSYDPEALSTAAKIIGVDVARFGDDRTVIFRRHGMISFPPVILRNEDTIQIAGRVAQIARDWESDAIFIDGTGGYGAGVADQMRSNGFNVTEVDFSSRANEPDRFVNIRAEMWWEMTTWVKERGQLPDDDELKRELTAPTYFFARDNAKMQLESKEQIKKRLGFSPDLADALALTFAYPVAPKFDPNDPMHILTQQMAGSAVKEYKPW